MTDKARICVNVNINTAKLCKLYKSEFGHKELDKLLDDFLNPMLTKKLKNKGIVLSINQTNECPKCSNGKLITRTGKSGEFIGCSSFPNCTYTKKTTQK